MRQRSLGPSLGVAAVGLGCMGMSGAHIDDAGAARALRAALDGGVTLFDTADVYGPFSNESLIGRVLASHRDSVVIASKFGSVRSSTGEQLGANGRPEYVRRSCDLSLQRLGTSHIDLYYQHRNDPGVPIEETVGAMGELVAEGKVRYLGLSRCSAGNIRRAHAVHPITAVQNEWSLWAREIENEVVAACRELDIGLVPYSPLLRGVQRIGDGLAAVAAEKGCPIRQLALAWLLHQGPDVVPIPGSRTVEHIRENIAAIDIHLTIDELHRIATNAS